MSAAVGVPAAEGDEEQVALFVVPRPGSEIRLDELQTWLEGQMPRYMRPTHIRVLPDLPRTPTNKVEKFRLRESLMQELGLLESEE